MADPTPLAALSDEYAAWCSAQKLPVCSADEQDPHVLTPNQRRWLGDFIRRWEAAEAAAG